MSNEDLLKKVLGAKGVVPIGPKRSKGYHAPDIKQAEVVSSENDGMIEFSDLKRFKRKITRDEMDLSNWTSYDFGLLCRQLYKKHKNCDWDLNWFPICNEILLTKDALADLFGFCDNLMTRDYIHFFFLYHFDNIFRQKGKFFMGNMRNKIPLEKFLNTYNYAGSANAFQTKLKQYQKSNEKAGELSNEAIEQSFLLSPERLAIDYGIVIAVNWLILQKGFKLDKAIKYVYTVCHRACISKKFSKVKKRTEQFSPYPSWFPFKQVNSHLKIISDRLIVKVTFNNIDNEDFAFLDNGYENKDDG